MPYKKLLRFIARAGMALALLAVLVMPLSVALADEAVVTCTVSMQLIAASTADGNVDYGMLLLGATNNTTASGLNDTQRTTNIGNVAEDFNIKSSDALGVTGNWTVSGAQGANQFTHEFSTNGGTSWTALTTFYQSWATNVSASGNRTFDLQIGVPTSTTDWGTHNITVTIQAVAPGD